MVARPIVHASIPFAVKTAVPMLRTAQNVTASPVATERLKADSMQQNAESIAHMENVYKHAHENFFIFFLFFSG